ncbi:hypothetical protein E0H75_21165 [Kribbella capetownensis]|uniref:Uncharacterized protein n=1 Tax=Kribbella capetownensis TaxID=1572659 RepID=A0A4R0K2I8_9ACTN|nr:hypothetical protein [Kribbella capetownensis]TCC49055.1 hypothetical protein E0H75_21165 [Kribbella capetownensis]
MTLELGDHVWYWNGQVSQNTDIPRETWFPGCDPNDRTDYLGNGKDIYHFVVHAGELARGRPHMRGYEGSYAWLNNNPGNITGSPGGPDYGQYPGKFSWHNFLVFPTWGAGYAAIAALLHSSTYAGLTLAEAFAKYAPASDGNKPQEYARDVAAAAGVAETVTVDQLDDAQMVLVQDKITEIEGVIAGDSFASDSSELPPPVAALLS